MTGRISRGCIIGTLISLLALLLLIGSAWAATEINSCTTISEPGEYVLNQSIITSNGSCISILTGDVTLDGAGYTIDGVNRNGIGVRVYQLEVMPGKNAISIENLTVKNWSVGFSMTGDNLLLHSSNIILNDVGILFRAIGASLSNNNVSLNKGGINSTCSEFCSIYNNTIFSNSEYGISLKSSNGQISENTIISNSGYGLLLSNSDNITIYNNYFDNPNNAKDNGNNTWNITKTPGKNIIGGSYLGGNFWSDYAGKDLDGDGLGDTLLPYNSSGNIINGGDYSPLVIPTPVVTTPAVTTPVIPPVPVLEFPTGIVFAIIGIVIMVLLLSRKEG